MKIIEPNGADVPEEKHTNYYMAAGFAGVVIGMGFIMFGNFFIWLLKAVFQYWLWIIGAIFGILILRKLLFRKRVRKNENTNQQI